MDNIELENKIKEIIAIDNYFDRQLAINDFEKDYKKSDFFIKTKKSLKELVKEYRINNLLSINFLMNTLQDLINKIDLTNIDNSLDKLGDTFGKENKDIQDKIDILRELFE